ncbi:MAG TPA: HD domain-containing phosphohydrolase [Bacillota bacterium]|nr:HD domain-containing phosphohydrolase [Bacillota bacterium]
MNVDLHVSLFELVECLAEAVDLISPELSSHHKRVAYISFQLAQEMNLNLEEQNNLTLAGFLHDSGGLAIKERLEALRFEVETPYQHAELGFRLFQFFKPLAPIAQLIRYHHLPYEEITKADSLSIPGSILLGSSILHLADRVAVLIDPQKSVLGQVAGICGRILEYSGKMFNPNVVASFLKLSEREYFWLDLISPSVSLLLQERANYFILELNLDLLMGLAKLFGQIIDFRSRFTAAHSGGTSACAEALGRLAGLSEKESQMLKVAGFLHDLGKIVVPESLLNKSLPLTTEEQQIIKSHSYYTYQLLNKIKNLEPVTSWAAFHHEKLNGSGYPFHFDAKNLSLGSRIICISDIFTALTEERPYRQGLSLEETLIILSRMVDDFELDGNLVSLLKNHSEKINEVRISAQNEAVKEYQKFWHAPMESFLESLHALTENYIVMERPIE